MSANTFGSRHLASSLVIVTVLGMGAASALADAPPGQYTASGGTVLDNKTKLVWQQAASSDVYTWADAEQYCTNNLASLPGTGWRLPSVSELQSIVDDSRSNPAIDPIAFPSTPSAHFWTVSPYQPNTEFVWAVTFLGGNAYYDATSTAGHVRCVR